MGEVGWRVDLMRTAGRYTCCPVGTVVSPTGDRPIATLTVWHSTILQSLFYPVEVLRRERHRGIPTRAPVLVPLRESASLAHSVQETDGEGPSLSAVL